MTGSRGAAYVQTRPHTTAYIEAGFWEARVAKAFRELTMEPGQVLLGGFDLVPAVMEE